MRYVLGLTVATLAVLAARPALANGRFPASNQIVFSPTNENVIVGRATYAILLSTDNGKTWGYLCEDAIALPGSYTYQDPELALTANDSLVAGLSQPTVGLDVSHDLGCNWSCIGGSLANQQIVDIVLRADTPPHRVLALTGTFSTNADAGTFSQLFQSPDDGKTWAALGTPIDSTALVATVDVAPTDPMRIYVSANRHYGTARTASLFVSMDDGSTWTEHPILEFNPPVPCVDAPGMSCQDEDQLFIAGVDPMDENVVYLRSNGPASTPTPGDSRLYVTKDGGQTFQMIKDFPLPTTQNTDYIQIGEMLGFALSPDGSKVFIGTKESGIWSASKTDLTFTNVNPKVHVQCLAARQTSNGPELWACSDEISGFIFGKSTDDGVSFTAMMATVTSMNGPVTCSASGATSAACFTDANASACSCSTYQMFCSNTESDNACLGCGQDGGGPPVSDAGENQTSSGRNGSSCGCSVVGGGGAAGIFAGCALAGIALGRRRKR